jgi:peptide-methionine (S)-S-oxide reductase
MKQFSRRVAALMFCSAALLASASAEQSAKVMPAPADAGLETLVLAGGCFWGVQGVFQHVVGVERAVSGYAGGDRASARYEIVSGGRSGHAEAVEVTYDPKTVSLGQLLRVFFSVAHDPTRLDAQGPDHGTQYRSAIFVSGPAQERVARDYIARLGAAKAFARPIVTRLEKFSAFHPAEDDHQDYLVHHPDNPYVVVNDLPKIEQLRRLLPALYRAEPKLAGR